MFVAVARFSRSLGLLWVALAGVGSCVVSARYDEHSRLPADSATPVSASGAPGSTHAMAGQAGSEATEAGTGADGGEGGTDGAHGYDPNGPCTPGVPRCHGDFGYQSCEQDGTWSDSHSCAGYSVNGTSSYCVDVPASDGSRWGTCVDPACWFWMTRGFIPGETPVGICLEDGRLNRCNNGGTLSPEPCAAGCSQVGMLDGRALGFCQATCVNGARECLGGMLYRECVAGRWQSELLSCAAGEACSPVSSGALPDIQCGGDCQLGTSRCSADRSAVETCAEDGQFVAERQCALGLCLPAGPQAECQAECSEGQHLCAWDGAASERACQSSGLWGPEEPCAQGSSCRVSGTLALGCVACIGASHPGGNAFGVADSRCKADALASCGADDTWQAAVTCQVGASCSDVVRGASSAAACSAPAD